MDTTTGTIPTPQQLADRAAIGDVLHLHSRGLDRRDAKLLASAYWPDATVDYGVFKGSANQFAPLVIGALSQNYQLTRHSVSNSMIEFRAGQALVESHVIAAHLLHSGTDELLFFSRYLDRVEKRDVCWRIKHRQVVMDWCRRHHFDDERESEAFSGLAKGTSADDPLLAFLNNFGQGVENE